MYYLQLTKSDIRLEKYSFIPMFGTETATYTESFNGAKEGTWFQLDEDGNENGKTGFDSQITGCMWAAVLTAFLLTKKV